LDVDVAPESFASELRCNARFAADSDDFAQAFRFQIAQHSDLISPTVPI